MRNDIVIVALGEDKPGLIAGITSTVSAVKGNIEDMDQVVLRGIFIMSLVVKLPGPRSSSRFKELGDCLIRKGKDLGLTVHVHRMDDLKGS